MKQIFTLSVLIFLTILTTALHAQVTETFDGTFPTTSGCRVVTGFSSANGGKNNTKSATTKSEASASYQTSYIIIPANGTIQFDYIATANTSGKLTLKVSTIDQTGTATLLSSLLVNNTVYQHYTSSAITAGTRRVLIQYTSTAGALGNTFVDIDNIQISGAYKYGATTCNSAPTPKNDAFTAATLSTAVTGNVITNTNGADTDPNNETLTAIVQTNAALTNGTLNLAADGSFTFTPKANFTGGAVTFTYTVTDNGYPALTATATVTITYPIVVTPTAVADSYTPETSDPYHMNILSNDKTTNNGGILVSHIVTQPAVSIGKISTDPQDNTRLIFTPGSSYTGGDITFTYYVTDGVYPGNSSTVTVTMQFPKKPVALADDFTSTTSTVAMVPVTVNDTKPNVDKSLKLDVVAQPATAGTVAPNSDNTQIIFTPGANYTGGDFTFTYRLSDVAYYPYYSDPVTVTMHFPKKPLAVADDLTFHTSTAQTLPLTDNDKGYNNSSLVATVVTQPITGGSVQPDVNKNLVFTPDPNTYTGGVITFKYAVSDAGYSAPYFSDTVTVTMHFPTAPTAKSDHFTAALLAENTTGNVILNTSGGTDVEPNNATLTATLVSGPVDANKSAAKGDLTFNANGDFLFHPRSGFTGGEITFTYKIKDEAYAPYFSNTATVTLSYPIGAALPVKLLSFAGSIQNGGVQLNWTVAENETGNYFEIQRSKDGQEFSTCGLLFCDEKTGTENYTFNEAIVNALSYYRLKMTGKDNSVKYSKILMLKSGTELTRDKLTVISGSGSSSLTVNYTAAFDGTFQVNLYTMSGLKIQTTQANYIKGFNTGTISLIRPLQSGPYILEVVNSKERNITPFLK